MTPSQIHPSAVIDPSAQLGDGVSIGPFSVVGPHCVVGSGTQLLSHVVLEENVRLGDNCTVASGAVLGGAPQDLNFKGESTGVEIGNGTVIREYVTINRATGGGVTRVGEGCFLMAYTHLAHNCQLGNRVIVANNCQMAGYVEIGDNAFISGSTVLHQFVKVGRLAIMAGFSGTRQDLPPFAMCSGVPATVAGINKVGLRRQGFSSEERLRLRKAFHILFFEGLNVAEAEHRIAEEMGAADPNVAELLAFVRHSKRGIRRPTEGQQTHLEDGAEGIAEPEPVA